MTLFLLLLASVELVLALRIVTYNSGPFGVVAYFGICILFILAALIEVILIVFRLWRKEPIFGLEINLGDRYFSRFKINLAAILIWALAFFVLIHLWSWPDLKHASAKKLANYWEEHKKEFDEAIVSVRSKKDIVDLRKDLRHLGLSGEYRDESGVVYLALYKAILIGDIGEYKGFAYSENNLDHVIKNIDESDGRYRYFQQIGEHWYLYRYWIP